MQTWTRRGVLSAAAAVTAATVIPGDAHASRPGPGTVDGSASALHPEGIAWDPYRRAFLVSSVRHGTVSVVDRRGTATTLAADPRMVSTLGVHVDALRRRILVAFADIGAGTRTGPGTVYQSSGLGIFDLGTGRLQHLVDLVAIPGGHVANDIAVDRHGTAYVTDAASDGVYRVGCDGTAGVFVRDARFANPTAGLNGIVWHPAGFLLAVSYTTGELWRIGADRTVTPVTLDEPLAGGDGMVLLPDGRLAVVTNTLLTPSADSVRILTGDRGWTRARAVRNTPWPDTAPSTATLTPHGLYVVAGSLDKLFLQGTTSDVFTIRRAGAEMTAGG